mgnify:CR=1 FL=1
MQSVYPTVLVTGESRAFEIEGFALENADRILVSSEGCEETATKGVPADTVLSFPAAGAFELCYYYANVGSMVIAEFAVRDVEYQGPTAFVSGVAEPVTVFGLTGEDTLRFVKGTDCETHVLAEVAYVDGVEVTLSASYPEVSVCYKLSPRTDFYRAPVALKVMGVS